MRAGGWAVRYCSPLLERPKEAATQAATRMKPLVLRWRCDMLLPPLLPLLLVFEPCECASEGREPVGNPGGSVQAVRICTGRAGQSRRQRAGAPERAARMA